jgi:hypothetical protein
VPKTVQQIRDWLDSPNNLKCILADIGYYSGSEQTMRLSTRGYYDGSNEYIPIIIGGVSFAESLSADLTVSISYGTLELENTGGTYDNFLTYIWKRRPINLYIGDVSWPKSDFTLIFSGLVENLVSSGESNLQLTLVDKLEQLNESITTRTLKDLAGYTAQNTQEEKLLPVLFGEVFNLSPILVDNGTGFDTGPWSASITGIQTTSGIEIGQSVTATAGAGRLYGGTASATVASIVDGNTITYSVPSGAGITRPIPGIITNLTINGVVRAAGATGIKVSAVTGTGGPIYKITDGSLDEIIEVRDKAAPIVILNNRSSDGEFTLRYNTFGAITCTARSRTATDCTVPKLISYIVKNYGKNTLTDNDLDLTNIGASRLAYKAGIYVTDRTNILEVCNQLARSINCGLYYSLFTVNSGTGQISTGKLRLIELKVPTSSVGAIELNDSLMIEGSLQVTESFSVKPSVKLAYCKNYTQQTQDLALALHSDHGTVFKDEYWYVESKDSAVEDIYKDTGIVQEEITHLLVTSEAQAEADKRLELWKTPRQLITATYLPHLMFVQLGDIVTLTSNRFGLSSGKPGLVYSITRDWITGLVEIGVLV